MSEEWMDTKAVAHRLCITVSACNRLAARGTLGHMFIGGRRLFKRSTIDAYLRDDQLQNRRFENRLKLRRGSKSIALEEVAQDAAALRSEGAAPGGARK